VVKTGERSCAVVLPTQGHGKGLDTLKDFSAKRRWRADGQKAKEGKRIREKGWEEEGMKRSSVVSALCQPYQSILLLLLF